MKKNSKNDLNEKSPQKSINYNKYKVISHAERMAHDDTDYSTDRAKKDVMVYQSVIEKDPSTNRMSRKSRLVKLDNAKALRAYRVSDFSVENLQAIDSPLLSQYGTLQTDKLSAVDTLEGNLAQLSNNINQ